MMDSTKKMTKQMTQAKTRSAYYKNKVPNDFKIRGIGQPMNALRLVFFCQK